MGLFNKKPPCPICGGKIGWLLPSKIEDEYICSDCYSKIDMQEDRQENLTMSEFREYLAFYERNQELKDNFVISQKIDFGLWDTKMIFDFDHRLFCLSKRPDKTVFRGSEITSVVITEDRSKLYELNREGLRRYESKVPDMARSMAPLLSQYISNKQMMERMERMNGDDNRSYNRTVDIVEPFKRFYVEITFNHPYWQTLRCDMDGPTFSNERPSISEYLSDYSNSIRELETLITAIKTIAFPAAVEINGDYTAPQPQFSNPHSDPTEEIVKYKNLLQQGIITEEEFSAKKKQLLGL